MYYFFIVLTSFWVLYFNKNYKKIIKNFYTEFLIHISFSNKLFYEEFQTYRELLKFLSCFILLCKLLIFRKTWLYAEGEGKKLEMYIWGNIHIASGMTTAHGDGYKLDIDLSAWIPPLVQRLQSTRHIARLPWYTCQLL